MANYRTSRILVWILFCAGLILFAMAGLVMGSQAMGHFDSATTRTLGQGELLIAAGFLILGPVACCVFRDVSLAIFGYHDQVLALRRDMNALATRAAGHDSASAMKPPAPWKCPTCETENGMNDKACVSCGKPFAA